MTPDRCEKVKVGGRAARYGSLTQALVNVSDNYNRSKVAGVFIYKGAGEDWNDYGLVKQKKRSLFCPAEYPLIGYMLEYLSIRHYDH